MKKVLNEYLSEEKTVSAFFGQSEIIKFEFQNKENQEQGFTVIIEDPDLKNLDKPEMSLVTDPKEWMYFVDKYHYPKPPEWNMIAKENVFILQANQKITLLFKFLSYRFC